MEGPQGSQRLAWLWKGSCMSAPTSSCTQVGQCMGRLILCLGVPSPCEPPTSAMTCDLCSSGSWGGVLETKGVLSAASCHPLQGVAGLVYVYDGLSPELDSTKPCGVSVCHLSGLQEQVLWSLCVCDHVCPCCVPQQCDLVSAFPRLLCGCLYPGCDPELGGVHV